MMGVYGLFVLRETHAREVGEREFDEKLKTSLVWRIREIKKRG